MTAIYIRHQKIVALAMQTALDEFYDCRISRRGEVVMKEFFTLETTKNLFDDVRMNGWVERGRFAAFIEYARRLYGGGLLFCIYTIESYSVGETITTRFYITAATPTDVM